MKHHDDCKINWILISTAFLVVVSSMAVLAKSQGWLGKDDQMRLTYLKGAATSLEEIYINIESLKWYQPDTDDQAINTSYDNIQSETFDFILLYSYENCINCVRDEIAELNKIRELKSNKVGRIVVYVLNNPNEDRAKIYARGINLNFPIKYDIDMASNYKIKNGRSPVLFVVRLPGKELIDVHIGIPEDAANRSAFFTRWYRLLQP